MSSLFNPQTPVSVFSDAAGVVSGFAAACLVVAVVGLVLARAVVWGCYQDRGAALGRVAPASPEDRSGVAGAHNAALAQAEDDSAWSSFFDAVALLGVTGFVVCVGVATLLAAGDILLRIID